MHKEQKLSYFINEAKSLDNVKFEKKIRISILGSFTLNGLEETLRVKSAQLKIRCFTNVSGYNQYTQDFLNPDSNLYKFSPDVVFLILDTRSILGNLYFSPYSLSIEQRKNFIEKKIDELIELIKTFTSKSKSKLVITNFVIPTYSPYGIYETKMNYSLKQMVVELNSKLSEFIMNQESVYLYDFNSFVTRYGENQIFDYRQYFFGDFKIGIDYLPYLANDFIGYVKAILGLNKKCIVLDLDNTLWGGIVGEDGFEGIKLGLNSSGMPFIEFQKVLLSLHQRGIILAINSKNNFDDAIQVIREHPDMILKEEHFASLKINWEDKVSNMKQITSELNIGLDSLVFFDDDPVNREYVKMNLPEVLTVEMPRDSSYYASTLLSMNDFQMLKITEEDTKRGKMYLQQKQRQVLQSSSTNLEDFLKQLNIKVKIKTADKFTIPRISQLSLKTNQFNLTTKRYQEEEIRKFSQNEKILVGCAQVEDKFGDNGITGVFIINKEEKKEWIIDTFLLSCRVMGRGVEDSILSHILKKAKEEGVEIIRGQYKPTKKNKPCENFLTDYGFKQSNNQYIFSLTEPIKVPPHITIVEQ